MSMTSKQYWGFAERSFRDASTDLVLPIDHGIVGMPVGAQFTGVSAVGPILALAAYNQPAVCLATWTISGGLLTLREEKVSGVIYTRRVRGELVPKRRRMFRDFPYPADANRMSAAVMRSDRELGLIRGTERAIHWIEKGDDGLWHFKKRDVLPASGYELIHSAVLLDTDHLWTIEGRRGFAEAALCKYHRNMCTETTSMEPHMFGIAVRKSDNAVLTVTDHPFRGDRGIYVNGVLKVPGVIGHGVALLDDGAAGAIVVYYGESNPAPFYGTPGAIIYVPPDLLAP